jgi:prepilin-type N-terminal cleavage/methylation domain-containing protein
MKKLRLNSRVKRAFQGSSRGLTMIEVLIAIALLGIISIAFLNSLSSASTVLFVADERTTAESLARRQIEYVKGQGYKADLVIGEVVISEPIYEKIGGIPEGYAIWSVNRDGEIVEEITGIPWDSENNKPADTDTGLQKIALVIKCQDEVGQYRIINTFINDNPNWADGVKITLEGYKVDR